MIFITFMLHIRVKFVTARQDCENMFLSLKMLSTKISNMPFHNMQINHAKIQYLVGYIYLLG